MPDLPGRTPAVVELAVQDEPAADAGADPHAEDVLEGPARAATVLAEDADAHVVVDRHLRPVHRLRHARAELDVVGEAGYVRGQGHDARIGVDAARCPDADAAQVAVRTRVSE